MLEKCRWALDFVRRWGKDDDLWRERIALTEAFRE